ncbi:MAG: glutamine amidotransferase subunit PdxT [Tenericutes bacterium GWC2_34_14]|nr:MAG: glutamine amidotransferase subunit PdxT [Tenericutes bacterium GWA2_35_7]OHE29107.1 MAG: glutamine amidotransferase subunit PdxT [Tenericutes bacterium GWC2_34_14]OHE34067.1 MAG: glutamine amidotransferase subunit PdxT [Tenericutes bacterium GWE2_34_108]OHE35397.1 MAG: glutamine amidotransferase subunit PdxT [Tenericutes bacterium GWF1_35_14]OHE38457.1 MAG: glutamine amidotransferase subunit PdxT [Tenericutes bacterium GWF2_35_184]OHE43097.1 MAG: glutamine amidotransferase subunit PdxT
MTIGILALQGAFIEHRMMLNRLGVNTFEIRQKKDLNQPMDGLILPGGESTAMGRLLKDLDLLEPLKQMIKDGLPVMGTCAGMILLASNIKDDKTVHFGLMDITVARNAYGRQLSSFYTNDLFNQKSIPMTFIRAPYIVSKGDHVSILSTVDGRWVAARQNHMLALAFHPELSEDLSVHTYFLEMISSSS